MRVCWSKKEEQETRNKIREHVLLLHLLCCVWGGSALTVVQTGHLGHVPVPDGLVEPLGIVESCVRGRGIRIRNHEYEERNDVEKGVKKERRNRRQKERSGRGEGGV